MDSPFTKGGEGDFFQDRKFGKKGEIENNPAIFK